MSQHKDCGPAFPTAHGYQGMTLRDYFAAKALEAICSCYAKPNEYAASIAHDAYVLADAMLEARAKQ